MVGTDAAARPCGHGHFYGHVRALPHGRGEAGRLTLCHFERGLSRHGFGRVDVATDLRQLLANALDGVGSEGQAQGRYTRLHRVDDGASRLGGVPGCLPSLPATQALIAPTLLE